MYKTKKYALREDLETREIKGQETRDKRDKGTQI